MCLTLQISWSYKILSAILIDVIQAFIYSEDTILLV